MAFNQTGMTVSKLLYYNAFTMLGSGTFPINIQTT